MADLKQIQQEQWDDVDGYLRQAIDALLDVAAEDNMAGIIVDSLSVTRQMILRLRKSYDVKV